MFPSNVCLVHQRSTWTPSLGCFFRGQLRLNFLFCFYFSFLSSSLKQYYLHVSLLEKGRWLKICMLFCTIWLKKVSFLNCVCFDLFSGCQQSTLFQIFFFFFQSSCQSVLLQELTSRKYALLRKNMATIRCTSSHETVTLTFSSECKYSLSHYFISWIYIYHQPSKDDFICKFCNCYQPLERS